MVCHGMVTHSFEERMECVDCLTVEIEYLQAIKKAGGMKKFLKQLKEEVEDSGLPKNRKGTTLNIYKGKDK